MNKKHIIAINLTKRNQMSAIFDFSSLVTVILLLICTTAYLRELRPTIFDDETPQGVSEARRLLCLCCVCVWLLVICSSLFLFHFLTLPIHGIVFILMLEQKELDRTWTTSPWARHCALDKDYIWRSLHPTYI